jgi:hypothetical protein
MKKYRLIKEYPGSPELGIEVEKESNSKSSSSYFYRSGDKRICVLNDHVEDNPEYWEEFNDSAWFVVSTRNLQKEFTLFEEWNIYEVCYFNTPANKDPLNYFKTKEQAEKFIVMNKPCLTLLEVSSALEFHTLKRNIFLELRRLVKQKI